MITEPLFDQIYHDLEPFWGARPGDIRGFAERWPNVISIRDGKPTLRSPQGNHTIDNNWLYVWEEMVRAMPPLPDVDLPMWIGDEPRVMLHFEHVTAYMKSADYQRSKHRALPTDRIRNEMPKYSKIAAVQPTQDPPENYTTIAPKVYWDFILDACKPGDPVFTEPQRQVNSSFPPVFSSSEYTVGTLKGFVSNYTMSKNVCYNPNLRSLHGHMIWPHLDAVYTELYPIFGVAKLVGASNDILVPSPDHWVDSGAYAGVKKPIAWKKKKAAAVWRGSATGGEHNETNWWGFQRHRFVSMTNQTKVSFVEQEMEPLAEPSYTALQYLHGENFDWGMNNIAFPNRQLFNITAQKHGKLGQWTGKVVDTGFTHFYCWKWRLLAEPGVCNYTEPYYHLANHLNMKQVLNYKYLPDIDGQSSSGRFRGFLQSLSVPIKATIFREWRDSRLVPWRHFVPMSNEFQEWWGLMEYFVGYKGAANETSVLGHDLVGQRIGQFGSDWTHRVERKEDMVLYFYRVILEFARICAEERVELGFVEDIPRAEGAG